MTNTATTPSGQPLGISHKPSATEAMFDRLKAENKPAFIGYLTDEQAAALDVTGAQGDTVA